MTLLDAPEFDYVRNRRIHLILYGTAGLLLVLFVGFWLAAGRPVDFPWNWNKHLLGTMTANRILEAVERNDLPAAYGIWLHDPDWRQHPSLTGPYTFDRFEQDWSSQSPDNEYGAIKSHKIVAATMHGNVLLMAALINGRKSKALNLVYDPKTHTLDFSPPDVEIYLGP